MKPNTIFRALCGLSLMLAGGIALADDASAVEHPFFGADYSSFSYKNSNAGSNANETAGLLRLGSVVVPWMGVEARFGTGFSKGSLTSSGVNYNVQLDSLYGAYVRPQWAAGPITIYGLLGYTYTRMTFASTNAPTGNFKADHDSSGTSFGGGAELKFGGGSYGVSADFLHYQSGQTGISVGAVYYLPD